jgi:hypothetical protein
MEREGGLSPPSAGRMPGVLGVRRLPHVDRYLTALGGGQRTSVRVSRSMRMNRPAGTEAASSRRAVGRLLNLSPRAFGFFVSISS